LLVIYAGPLKMGEICRSDYNIVIFYLVFKYVTQ
jgi:hypothetical protein